MSKARSYLPTAPDAPEQIKKLYEFPEVDFDTSLLDRTMLIAFEQLVGEICHDFTVYSGMFGTDKKREASFQLGKDVMHIVERAMLTQICLRYSALVNDKWDAKNKEVVSFKQLIQPLRSCFLNSKLKLFDDFYQTSGLKHYRNKIIAHNDLKAFREGHKKVPKLSTELIEKQLSDLNECLNYLKERQDVYTDTYITLNNGEGLDKYYKKIGLS
tara:strand:+ start:957 stop:1598 length:642 start_codon:yes stop_codon:yes gene_type:complete